MNFTKFNELLGISLNLMKFRLLHEALDFLFFHEFHKFLDFYDFYEKIRILWNFHKNLKFYVKIILFRPTVEISIFP